MTGFCGLPLLLILYQFRIIHAATPESVTCDEKYFDLQLAHSRLQLEHYKLRQQTNSCPGLKLNPSDIIIINEAALNANIISANNSNIEKLPSSCADVSTKENGVYELNELIPGQGPLSVTCIFDVHDGGWLTIQRRINGTVNFNRSWQDYKNGFGDVNGEHWLGLEHIHKITTKDPQELLILLEDFENGTRWAKYDWFIVGDESEQYPIKSVGAYTGDAGESFGTHLIDKFSTFDKDNDVWFQSSCARRFKSGWWFNRCGYTNLNGPAIKGAFGKSICCLGIQWEGFRGQFYSLKSTQMMLRPRSYKVPESDK